MMVPVMMEIRAATDVSLSAFDGQTQQTSMVIVVSSSLLLLAGAYFLMKRRQSEIG